MNNEIFKDDQSDLARFGMQLRDIRVAQGRTIQEISEATHIRPNILESIEEGVLDGPVAPVYMRGFVKTYCAVLDAEDIWEKYLTRINMTINRTRYDDDASDSTDISVQRPVFRRSSMIWLYVVLVVAIFLCATFIFWNQSKETPTDDNGFFLRQRSEDITRSNSEPKEEAEQISATEREAVLPEVPAVSADQEALTAETSADEEGAALSTVSEDVPAIVSHDLSWLDAPQTSHDPVSDITVIQSTIPDQQLMIEITAPVRLIVQQGGEILTRRNMTAGGVRSYDVTTPTSVSLTAGNAAEITWYGKRYAPIGANGSKLDLTFYPDGTIRVTDGIQSNID